VSLTQLTTKKIGFKVKYLREYEAISRKALTRVSGAQMELFYRKTRGRKSCDRVPLIFYFISFYSGAKFAGIKDQDLYRYWFENN
jgi:hypothetical protein